MTNIMSLGGRDVTRDSIVANPEVDSNPSAKEALTMDREQVSTTAPDSSPKSATDADNSLVAELPKIDKKKYAHAHLQSLGLKEVDVAAFDFRNFYSAILPPPAHIHQHHWREWVIESGVSPEITSRNIRSLDDSREVARILNRDSWKHGSGSLVRGVDPVTGENWLPGVQFKPDAQVQKRDKEGNLKFKKDGTPDYQKYFSAYDRPAQPLFLDIGELGYWKQVLDDLSIPFLITEGGKKAGAVLSALMGTVAAISIPGVTTGQKLGRVKELVEMFCRVGRTVLLAFDSDAMTKKPVRDALDQLGKLISAMGAVVKVVLLPPDTKGLDDYLVKYGTERLRKLIDDAIPFEEWREKIKKSYSAPAANHPIDNQNLPIDNHPEAPFREVCKFLKLDFNNCVTLQHFDGWAYRQVFGGNDGDWWVKDSTFYHWDDKIKSWVHKKDNLVYKIVADSGEKAYRLKYTDKTGWRIYKPYECNSYKKSAFEYVRTRLIRPEVESAEGCLIAFNNCVVDSRTGETLPHDRKYYLTSRIPYDYEPGKECPSVFKQFIIESFGEDMLSVIRAFTSMFLDPTAPYGRFPHLIGQSGGGKGTLGRFWNSLFGQEGSGTSADFSNISTPEGRHQYLTGKRIFGFPDVGGFAQGLRAFYELVDNGAMSGRALYDTVGYSRQWFIRFWIASVSYLQIENAGDGWARRAYPIPALDRNVKPDPNLKDKLEAVKADIISWALAMPREERDRILLSPPQSERAMNSALDAALYSDSTKSFVELCFRPSSNNSEFLPSHQLHTWYIAYCREHGYTPLGMTKFISHLKTVLPRNFVERRWVRTAQGERKMQSAHWECLAPMPGVFVTWEPDKKGSSENSQPPSNPVWNCIKANCQEGGLKEFEQFWNSSPPTPPTSPPVHQDQGDLEGSKSLLPLPSQPVHPVQIAESLYTYPQNPETQLQQACTPCTDSADRNFNSEKDQVDDEKNSENSKISLTASESTCATPHKVYTLELSEFEKNEGMCTEAEVSVQGVQAKAPSVTENQCNQRHSQKLYVDKRNISVGQWVRINDPKSADHNKLCLVKEFVSSPKWVYVTLYCPEVLTKDKEIYKQVKDGSTVLIWVDPNAK